MGSPQSYDRGRKARLVLTWVSYTCTKSTGVHRSRYGPFQTLPESNPTPAPLEGMQRRKAS